MKYKLKNTVTGEEAICEKVVVGGFEYYVNEDEIPDETYYMSFERDYATEPQERFVLYVKSTGLNGENPKKVIATTNKSLDLPMVIDKVEDLALQLDKSKCRNFKREHTKVETYEGIVDGYILGFHKAKETYSFTKDDMVEFVTWVKSYAFLNGTKSESEYSKEELFDLWQEQRTIEE